MDKLDMTPEQQLAFDGFIDVMVQIYTFAEFLSNGNDPVYGMFESTGEFTIEELPGESYVLSKEGVSSAIRSFEKAHKHWDDYRSCSLSECEEYTKKRLWEQIREAGLAPEKIMEHADGELSAVVIGEGQEPTAQVIVGRSIEPAGLEILFAGTDQQRKNPVSKLGRPGTIKESFFPIGQPEKLI